MRCSPSLQGIATALVLTGVGPGSLAYAGPSEMQGSAPCAITHASGGILENDALTAVLPSKGKFVFEPEGPGFVDEDGALGIKVAWGLRKRGTLFVAGRRLDGAAPRARAYISSAYDDYVGGMSLFLVFPTPGCWEITGALGDAKLTFVVEVQLIGDGPSSHMHGPPRGWRLTTRWSEREGDKVLFSFITPQRVAQRGR